jgi:acyl-CoA thioesterase-2
MTSPDEPTLLDVLQLEAIELNLYRSTLTFREEYALYGGQVAAQALLAAGLTVTSDRLPHSLHGYFLRGGDPHSPTVFHVFRDRDGGSYSARRVVAVQAGEVIFNMSSSFHRFEDGPATQAAPMPEVVPPDELPPKEFMRLFSIESRLPEGPFPEALWPTRFWARATVPLPDDPLMHACALTYLSDISTGILPAADGAATSGSSIDHAVWFHRPVDMNEWTLTDYHPQVAAAGRGWYTGSVFTPDGVLVASLAQEALFRAGRPGYKRG